MPCKLLQGTEDSLNAWAKAQLAQLFCINMHKFTSLSNTIVYGEKKLILDFFDVYNNVLFVTLEMCYSEMLN